RRVDDEAVLRCDALEDGIRSRGSRGAGQRRQSGPLGPTCPYLVTRFPATYTSAILRTFEMSVSGSASSTTKSAHLPASSVPRSLSSFWHFAASRVADNTT